MLIKRQLGAFKHKIKLISKRAPLPTALGLAIIATFILTIISVTIYYTSGVSRLDLSRPGYEREREEVRTDDTAKTYDTTSPIDRAAIDEFLKEYDERVKELQQYGDFKDQALEDTSLQLTDQTPALQ